MSDSQDFWTNGELCNISFPYTYDAFYEAGPEFLTDAFRTTGAIEESNQVIAVENFQEVAAGGMGRKARFTVRYAEPAPHLKSVLFAKFSLEADHHLRHIYEGVMNSEVALALLSRDTDFPIKVPECYFADLNAEQGEALLITECIPFGQEGVEPEIEKAMDHQLTNTEEYYHAIARALSRLAAYDKSGKLQSPLVSHLKPGIKTHPVIGLPPEELDQKLDALGEFIQTGHNLLPAQYCDKEFADSLAKWVPKTFKHYHAIKDDLNAHPKLAAICHWNPNIDNGWFWRDENKQMQAGLFDWGNVGNINLASAFCSSIAFTEIEVLEKHFDALVDTLLSEYKEYCGVEVTTEDFQDCFNLLVATDLTALLLDLPAFLTSLHPDLDSYESYRDPRLEKDFVSRLRVVGFRGYSYLWKQKNVNGTLERYFN